MASNEIEYDSKLFVADDPAVGVPPGEAARVSPPTPPAGTPKGAAARTAPPSLPPPPEKTAAPHPEVQNMRTSLRFRVEEAMADLSVKGLLTSIGLGRVQRQQAALNLSSGGALLACSDPHEPGALVHVHIEIPGTSDVIEADGEVVRCAQGKGDPPRYLVGLKFVGLDGPQRGKIEAMRRWFTSPEYRLRRSSRRRDKGPSFELMG